MIYLSGVNYESINDAEGVSCVLFVSGCKHCCKGCHSPNTHNFTYGTPVTEDLVMTIKAEINKRPFLKTIVLSGGDCMYSPTETLDLLKKVKEHKFQVWCYTGFTFEELIQDEEQLKLLKEIDVLVDGPFDMTKRDITLAFRGSTNQRIIDVKTSLKEGTLVLYGNYNKL